MNIAILIGVSEYNNLQKLSACKNDVKIINDILSKNEKYSEILFIDNETTSRNIKQKVIEFIEKHHDQNINEIFIYFSGHGYFDGEEFYYICTDYNKDKLKQTSFENKEFDTYIKSLDPKLTIKVIDACQSGMNYVKDTSDNEILDFFSKGKGQFKNCYFMYSSSNNQASYADDNISHFTKEFINALIHFKNDIRYKDIVDYLSDSFNGKSQKPHFVIQGNLTEKFISISDDTTKLVLENLKIDSIEKNDEQTKKDLFNFVKEDAEKYFTKEKLLILLNEIQERICKKNLDEDDIGKYFKINYIFYDNYDVLPKKAIISNWIHENNNDYFVKPIFANQTRKIRVPKNKMLITSLTLFGEKDNDDLYMTKEEIISVAVSIETTTEIPFNYLCIKTNANFPNLHNISFFILPFVSKRKIIFFTTFAIYKNINWDDEKIDYSTIQWKNNEFDLIDKDGIFKFIDTKIEEFCDKSINEVKAIVNFDETKD